MSESGIPDAVLLRAIAGALWRAKEVGTTREKEVETVNAQRATGEVGA
jgi:hypothetical protein